MIEYLRNIRLWLRGFRRLDDLNYKAGWSASSFLPLYLLDVGACVVLLAGPVCTVTRYAQMHRSGAAWDKLLDVLERFDAEHGQRSGPVMWGSVEPPKWVRIVVPVGWLALIVAVVA